MDIYAFEINTFYLIKILNFQEILKRKGLEVNSIIISLEKKWKSGKTGLVICMEAMTK